MATPQCMSNDGNPAIFVGTFFPSGDSVALCNECMPSWASVVVAGMLGIDPGLMAAGVAAMEQDSQGENAIEPTETAAPPAMIETPNTDSSAPEPAPADADQEVGLDPTPSGSPDGTHSPESRSSTEEPGSGVDESPPTEPLQVGDPVE